MQDDLQNAVKELCDYFQKFHNDMLKFSNNKITSLNQLEILVEKLKNELNHKKIDSLEITYAAENSEKKDSSTSVKTKPSNETSKKGKLPLLIVETSQVAHKQIVKSRIISCKLLKKESYDVKNKGKSKNKEKTSGTETEKEIIINKLCEELIGICKEYYGYISTLLPDSLKLAQHLQTHVENNVEKIDGVNDFSSKEEIAKLYHKIDNFIAYRLPEFQELQHIVSFLPNLVHKEIGNALVTFFSKFECEINKPMQLITRLPMLLDNIKKYNKNPNTNSTNTNPNGSFNDETFRNPVLENISKALSDGLKRGRSHSVSSFLDSINTAKKKGEQAGQKEKFQSLRNRWEHNTTVTPSPSLKVNSSNSSSSSTNSPLLSPSSADTSKDSHKPIPPTKPRFLRSLSVSARNAPCKKDREVNNKIDPVTSNNLTGHVNSNSISSSSSSSSPTNSGDFNHSSNVPKVCSTKTIQSGKTLPTHPLHSPSGLSKLAGQSKTPSPSPSKFEKKVTFNTNTTTFSIPKGNGRIQANNAAALPIPSSVGRNTLPKECDKKLIVQPPLPKKI